MPLQIFNPVWDAALCQIGGRSERTSFIRTQSARDKTRIFGDANPDRYVDTFLYEVAHRIADPQVDRNLRVAFTKQRQLCLRKLALTPIQISGRYMERLEARPTIRRVREAEGRITW